jgi:hypothetical protein
MRRIFKNNICTYGPKKAGKKTYICSIKKLGGVSSTFDGWDNNSKKAKQQRWQKKKKKGS